MPAAKFLRVDSQVHRYVTDHMQGLDTVNDALRRLLDLPSAWTPPDSTLTPEEYQRRKWETS